MLEYAYDDYCASHLAEGRTFTVEARNLSAANKYVQAITLNGRPVAGIKLSHADIMRGGTLVFDLGPQPAGKR